MNILHNILLMINPKSTFVKEFFVSGILYKKLYKKITQYQDVECTLFKLLFQ